MDRLADRFESLLVQQIVLKELEPYIHEKLVPLLGDSVAATLHEMLRSRHDMTGVALEALRQQYPAYAEELERRILHKIWLRQEDMEYRTLFEGGVIGPELYSALRREVQLTRTEIEKRPRLDLGLKTRELIAKVPIFGKLTQAQLDTIGNLLRPRFAVPEEQLIRDGDHADAMYFISSGSVEVEVAGQKIRLNPGDFFGEMALVSGRRRRGNVYARSYCQLLVLGEVDFKNLLKSDHEIQTHIASVANARSAMNQRAGSAAPD